MYLRRFYFIILVYANLKMEYDTKDKTFWKRKGKDMKVLLGAVNAKYIHSNLAVYCLKVYAEKYGDTSDEISIGEYTINQQLDEILRDIYKRKPDMLCLSCYIWNLTYVEEICREIKKVMPQIIIWIGGPEVSYDGVKVLERLPEVDGVMKGEGEQTFCDLLHFYQNKTVDGLQNMKGIVYREQTGQIVENEWRKTMDLSKVPFVYENMELFEHKIIYYETSRGCPFSCSYCLSSIDKCLRFRDLELVKKELQFFIDHKVPQVKFVDRTFNCKHDHAMTVWRYIKEHDNGITNFHFEVAADLLNEEEMELIKTMRPGLIQLEIGVQSTNGETVDAIHRHMDLDKLFHYVDRVHKLGNIHQHLDLIAGLPYENYERFGCSFDDLYAHEPDQLQLGFLKVLKGTMMEEEVKKYSILYRNQPPYEVLGTKWLSYDEIILLKGVEELVELYYNSGQYTLTLKYAVPFFESPFRFYEMFSAWYRGKGYHKLNHNRLEKYNILREFLREHIDENEWDTLDEIMLYDMYLRENVKGRPAWAKDTAQYKKEWKALYREQGEKLFPEDVQAGIYDSKRAANQSHIEVFEINIKKFEQSGQVEKKQVFCLFDYSRRNPLNRAARTVEWEIL